MAGQHNVTSQQSEAKGKEAGNRASSAFTASASDIWSRAADSACREVSATIESSGLAVRGLCEMQTQWWSFLERTLRRSLDASQQLKGCTDYAAVVDRQRQFFEDRVRDLVAETTEMMRLSSRLATSSIEAFTARRGLAKPPARR